VIPPQQVQVGVTHRETGDEAADLIQILDEAAPVADVSRVSRDDIRLHSLGRGSGKASQRSVEYLSTRYSNPKFG